MAMHNIEERFIVAAALEQFTALVWFFKRLYGWPGTASDSAGRRRTRAGPPSSGFLPPRVSG